MNTIAAPPSIGTVWMDRGLPILWGFHSPSSGVRSDARIVDSWDALANRGMRADCENVVIAVVDSGVDFSHIDLANRRWVNPAEANGLPGVDDDQNGYVDDISGWDFHNADNDPTDDFFHGTHVAGTIGAEINNYTDASSTTAYGVAGICQNAKIAALKILNQNGGGTLANITEGMWYLANFVDPVTQKAVFSVSNHSWGYYGIDIPIYDAVRHYADDGDGFLVGAAGNDNRDIDIDYWAIMGVTVPAPFTYGLYPASYNRHVSGVISVAASDESNEKAGFSNYGKTTLDIAAPGVNILSTMPTNPTPYMIAHNRLDNFTFLNGTSMAAPHVAGSAALIRSIKPNLSNYQIRRDLRVFSDDDPHFVPVSGRIVGGRLNLIRSITRQ